MSAEMTDNVRQRWARDDLCQRILENRHPIVVVEGPAGMGKSVLLEELAARLGSTIRRTDQIDDGSDQPLIWDVPTRLERIGLPESLIAGERRLILAKRPETRVEGLHRALAYGTACLIDRHLLLFSEAEIERIAASGTDVSLLRATGGWPLAAAGTQLPMLKDFLRVEFLASLRDSQLVELQFLLEGESLHEAEGRALLPLARRDEGGRQYVFAAPALAEDIGSALAAEIADRLQSPGGAREIAAAFSAHGRVPDAIAIFQKAGLYDNALKFFADAGGPYFLYHFGLDALDRVLSGFPHSVAHQSETIVLALTLQALKRGDISRAKRLLVDRYGDYANDAEVVFSPNTVYSRDFRALRVLMFIYEDFYFSDEMLARVFTFLSEFPSDAHLFRGMLYNDILEYYIRTQRYSEAEDVAQRAMFHYRAAGIPLLCFYISLHRSMMGLLKGDAVAARLHAQESASLLEEVPFETPNDQRLQKLLEACVDYEGGRADPLAHFLNVEMDDFSHGEIWPTLLEFALRYGGQAMADHFSIAAARGFLDRWRVYQASNRQFQMMISLREVNILQNGRRWREAMDVLRLQGDADRRWLDANSDIAALLREPDELALALAWVRQTLFDQPDHPGLEPFLTRVFDGLHITERQRIAAGVWLAYLHKLARNLTEARSVLQKALETAARLGAVAALAEERVFLDGLIDNQRIGGFVMATASIRQIVRKLRDSSRLSDLTGVGGKLSRRESKILIMLTEGDANKEIAAKLGLSEATVKFHLGNVYRKLGCRNRQEAIGSARALGLLR